MKEGVKKGYAYQVNDLNSLDELIYKTSTVACDTCLADVKQELADPVPKRYGIRQRHRYRQAVRLTPGPGVKDGESKDEQESDEPSVNDEEPEDLDEPEDEDAEDTIPPVLPAVAAGSGEAASAPPPPPPPPSPPPPPAPIAAVVSAALDPFEDELAGVNTRVPEGEPPAAAFLRPKEGVGTRASRLVGIRARRARLNLSHHQNLGR